MRTLSLISDTNKPCGVEGFARGLAARLALRDGASQHETFALTGQPGEQALLARSLAATDALIVNLPVVAWKKVLVGPAIAMRAALRRNHDVILVLHEWADLDWKRRISYWPCVRLATRILFSSPLVQRQFEADRASKFATRNRGLVPIPPNLERPDRLPETALAMRLAALRAEGVFVLGHFGAIYPKKQSIDVLDIAAHLKAAGRRVHAVFIGDFIGGATVDPQAPFKARMATLGLDHDVTITGYIGPSDEVFAAIAACDALVYLLPEGLTARRGSVLAGLQTATPIVVNAPKHAHEFDHHAAFSRALNSGALTLLAPDASPEDFARALAELPPGRVTSPPVAFDAAWADVVAAVTVPDVTDARRATAA
jgi:glycosyltransferase involved in cell wall biosynthesis